uniref:Ras and Rab interactor 2 n=1 Tax=Iconisemion striatum TaxID=60296 RepID=A0A1A7Y0K1_9TELE
MPVMVAWINETEEKSNKSPPIAHSPVVTPSPPKGSGTNPATKVRRSLSIPLPLARPTKHKPRSKTVAIKDNSPSESKTFIRKQNLSRQKAIRSPPLSPSDEVPGGCKESFSTQLPFPCPPTHLRSNDIDIDVDDEDEEDEEEPECSISPESDQEQDVIAPLQGSSSRRSSSGSGQGLQNAFRGNLRKVSGVFISLLTPEKRTIRRVRELSKESSSNFGTMVQEFLRVMRKDAETHTSEMEMLQTIRNFMTQMKNYLLQSSEMELRSNCEIPENEIDQVLEKALLKCVLKPLKPALSSALQKIQERNGQLQKLKDNLHLAAAKKPEEVGDALMPDSVAIEKIKQKFQTLCKLYNPEKKVVALLRVCKLIYKVMEESSGRLYGADEFLPMLTYVLAQCDMPQLDSEIVYTMELLDPSLLTGEGGYYLTSAYGAMSIIKNFQKNQPAMVLSSETRDTLCQWHRRHTAQRMARRSAPCIDDLQSFLRVALQDPNSGCTAKTVTVEPQATVEEVCRSCAQKFDVSDPENYGLFLQTDGSSQQLAPDSHPQRIKAELHSGSQEEPFHFIYRRVTKD